MASTRHDAAEDVKPRVPHEGSRPEIAASHTRPASHPCARASEPGAKAFEEDVAAEHVDDGEQMQRQVEMARVIASLKLTRPEILRTTSAHNVLHRFGFVLRKGPYSTEYERSSQSQEIAQFWSHSWHGPVLAKIMLLYVVCNGFPAAAMGTISIAVAKTLAWHCVLPCDDRALEATLCLFIGLLVSGLTLAFWRPSRRIFLDKICINQKDVDLRTEGVLNVGAFLKCSKSMLACWDATYMQRLWCVLEMAAFLTSHSSSAELDIKPVHAGPCVIISFACISVFLMLLNPALDFMVSWVGSDVWFYLLNAVTTLPIITVCLSLATAALRMYFRDVEAVREQLRRFSFQRDPDCACCALKHVHPSSGRALNCDKETLGQSIRLWFGSVDAFDTFVQQDVLFAFNKTFASYGLPYSWLAGATVPVVWCGVAYYIPQDDAFSGNLLPEFSTVIWLLCWWLAYIPIMVLLWMKVVYAFRARRSYQVSEVLTNVVCAFSLGLLYGAMNALDGLIYTGLDHLFQRPVRSQGAELVVATIQLIIVSGFLHCGWGRICLSLPGVRKAQGSA
ncbi:unnamed protein product [Symbiodinium natans]|uniref:Uncharacterized protein n=1 Tax=Symbiodinium natans TaxID=878477 RepID=A0A812PL28_9DINO|nr:unnamed protein product [Symbiodinium natans]